MRGYLPNRQGLLLLQSQLLSHPATTAKGFKVSIMRTQSSDLRRSFGVVLARLLEQHFLELCVSLRVPALAIVTSRESRPDWLSEYAGKTVLCLGRHEASGTRDDPGNGRNRAHLACRFQFAPTLDETRKRTLVLLSDSAPDAVKQRLASLSSDHLGACIRLVELKDACADGSTKAKARRRHLRWPVRYGISSEALAWSSQHCRPCQ